MPFVHVVDFYTGRILAMPAKMASYLAQWNGSEWILTEPMMSYRNSEVFVVA
jgi:hypothetical protein